MADEPDDIDFDAPPPPDAGDLVSERSAFEERVPSLPSSSSSSTPFPTLWDPPNQPPEHATLEEQMRWFERHASEFEGYPFIRISAKSKSYFLYAKYQFTGTLFDSGTGAEVLADSIEMIMDTGHGRFQKRVENSSSIKKTEEKFGNMDFGGHAYVLVRALKGTWLVEGVAYLK